MNELSVLQAIKVTWLQNIHKHLLKEFNLKAYYLCFPHDDLEFFQLWSILKTHRDPKVCSLSDAGCILVLCNVSSALSLHHQIRLERDAAEEQVPGIMKL